MPKVIIDSVEREATAEELADFAALASPSAVVPETISDRQFFQQLAIEGVITEAEALAAVATGTIPAAMGRID